MQAALGAIFRAPQRLRDPFSILGQSSAPNALLVPSCGLTGAPVSSESSCGPFRTCRFANRCQSGRDHAALERALTRLAGFLVKTNIIKGRKEDAILSAKRARSEAELTSLREGFRVPSRRIMYERMLERVGRIRERNSKASRQ